MCDDIQIIRAGHPVLRKKTQEIQDPTAPKVRDALTRMEKMIAKLGSKNVAGLAAPQIDVSMRVFLYTPIKTREQSLSDQRSELDIHFEAVINPVIEPIGNAKEMGWEACYSMPDLAFHVPRYNHIRMHYTTPQGTKNTLEAKDYEARILQHEFDHLEGCLAIDRLESTTEFGYVEEVKEFLMEQSSNT